MENKSIKCFIYSRIVGYYSPVNNWNKGKQEEFTDRKVFNLGGHGEYNSEIDNKTDRS